MEEFKPLEVLMRVPRYDTLGLYKTSLQVRQLMEPDERVFYSCNIEKFNRYGFCQDRILMITNKNIYTMSKGQFNYTINRKAPVLKVDGVTLSKDPKVQELVIHSQDDFDNRYRCIGDHKTNLRRVLGMLLKVSNRDIKVYEVPEKKLSSYVTTKSDFKKGNHKRPSL